MPGGFVGASLFAFDHGKIILEGLLKLRRKIIGPAFRRKIASKITETGEYIGEKGHRPSQYYKYKGSGENEQ